MTGVKRGSAAVAALLAGALVPSSASAYVPPGGVPSLVTPAHGSVRIEPIRAADPAGGAPWGVRTFRLGSDTCAQFGRIVGGKLGQIDDHGAFTPAPYNNEDCSPTVEGRVAPASYEYGLRGGATNAPVGCTLGTPPPGDPTPVCPADSERNLMTGQFGSDLVGVTVADADGSNSRKLAIGPRGDFLMVTREGFNDATEPRITLRFDSGCSKRGRQRISFHGAKRHGCTIVVPDLLGPHPAQESADSKAARLNPSAPVKVTAEAQPNVHARVFFLAKFRAPITIEPGDSYSYRVRGPGHYPSCDGQLDETAQGFGGGYDTIRGRMTSVLVQPLDPSDHRRFCPGRFTVDVFFVDQGLGAPGHAYAPFGQASIDVPAVPETHR